jgi:hypothetical protein
VKLFGIQRRKETTKALQFLDSVKAIFECGTNIRQKFTGPKKGQLFDTDDAVSTFIKRAPRLE